MKGESVVLAVGQRFHLRWGKDRIVYAGMPSDAVYSFAQMKQEGYRGLSWNLYFPRNRREITIDTVTLHIESVTPDEVRFRVAQERR